MEFILFGNTIYYDVLQIAIVSGIIAVLLINFRHEILHALGRGSYKMEIGDSFWTFMGLDGVHYSNAKLLDRKRNPFGNWNITLRAVGGVIVLPNVCMDTTSPDCNIKIVNVSHAASGVVDVFCNIDANGKPCEWNYRFDEHKTKMEKEAEHKAIEKLKDMLARNKEFESGLNDSGASPYSYPKV